MEPITETRRRTLLIELHRLIEVSATEAASMLSQGNYEAQVTYPPNGELTADELHDAFFDTYWEYRESTGKA